MKLASLFPAEVVTVTATPEMWSTPVFPEEEALISQALEKRQREFRAGRHCAHAALERLGHPREPILRDPKRAPLWPKGYLGSISHCRDFCLAVCCPTSTIKGLGVDVEPLAPLKPGICNYIQTEAENTFMQANSDLPERLIFSAKESLYKCLYPLVKDFFGFHSVELKIDRINQQFTFAPTAKLQITLPADLGIHGNYLISKNHLLTSCYLTH